MSNQAATKGNNPEDVRHGSHPSRRDFLGLAAVSAAALVTGGRGNSLGAAPSQTSAQARNAFGFPKDFAWGTATAAFQIEGAAALDGKGASIWDEFSRQPGAIKGGDTADVACDFYHRYPDDVKLMAELGVKHFRFSISWPRVLPDGTGKVNEMGLDFYKKLSDTLLAHGITPHATLYHWDLPQSLQKRYGGWQSRQIVEDFSSYASLIGKELGDRIRHWMTLNEIFSFTSSGYGIGKPGMSAPGVTLSSEKERNQIIHHALLAHGAACLALRASCPKKPNVSLAENYWPLVPAVATEAGVEAACKAFRRENGGRLMPILTGSYDAGWLEDHKDSLPEVRPGDMRIIHQPLDALGCNCYTGKYVTPSDNPKGYELVPWFPKFPVGGLPWLHIVPESIYWAVRLIGEAVHRTELPIFISENGYADGAVANNAGLVQDVDRIMYFRAYLTQLARAISEGFPVLGFFPWSFMDNFEWTDGYAPRFGLVHLDYATQQRTPKLSFEWYREVIRSNCIA